MKTLLRIIECLVNLFAYSVNRRDKTTKPKSIERIPRDNYPMF